MRSSRQPRSAHSAGHAHGHGAIVRGARTSQGLTLAELGARVGYSAAQVSRYERGIAPLTDITVLRRFAAVLGIPDQLFGLTPAGADDAGRHAVIPVKDRPSRAHGNTVDRERQREDGDEEDMRRRELLAGTAALAGAAALGSARRTRPARPRAWRCALQPGRGHACPAGGPA